MEENWTEGQKRMDGVRKGSGECGGGRERQIKWREGSVKEQSNFEKSN